MSLIQIVLHTRIANLEFPRKALMHHIMQMSNGISDAKSHFTTEVWSLLKPNTAYKV